MFVMGKLALVSAKYVITALMHTEGIVEKPDVIGAIFGQTEGLLGKDMELRELQKSGRIGRIEVDTKVVNGKTEARITVPSSLDKTETAIIAAAIETIERIGPCNGKIRVEKIEDVRVSKKGYIQERAKEILSKFMDLETSSQELTDEIKSSVRSAKIINWGPDKLDAGPGVDSARELILVEGRADVLTLLRNGVDNVISTNGTSIPKSLADLMSKKVTISFVDGDRGGDLIIKALSHIGKLDFVARAPDGKEVEELTSKEVFKALRAREPFKQSSRQNPRIESRAPRQSPARFRKPMGIRIPKDSKDLFIKSLKAVAGSGQAEVFDTKHKLLGRVPVKSIKAITGLGDVFAVIVDGVIDDNLLFTVKKVNARYLVGRDSRATKRLRGLTVISEKDLQ